jgi:tetratricopeptide (TPR) repeat protein
MPWAYRGYGYRYLPKRHGCAPQAAIEPVEADVVRHIYRLLVEEHLSCRQITKRLNASHTPTPSGRNQVWHPATVRTLLTNRVYAGQALELARRHGERGDQAYALRLLGDIAAQREPPEREQAEAHYRQALALADELGMRPLQAHCHRGLGTLYAKIGQWEQACAELSAAIDLYKAMAMTFWLPEAERALAEVKRP